MEESRELKAIEALWEHMRATRAKLPEYYAEQHRTAWREAGNVRGPDSVRSSVQGDSLEKVTGPMKLEVGLRMMIEGLAMYAAGYEEVVEEPIGNDGVLGDYWVDIARSFVGLLNGDAGRLDCGSLDRLARDLAVAAGFTADFEDVK